MSSNTDDDSHTYCTLDGVRTIRIQNNICYENGEPKFGAAKKNKNTYGWLPHKKRRLFLAMVVIFVFIFIFLIALCVSLVVNFSHQDTKIASLDDKVKSLNASLNRITTNFSILSETVQQLVTSLQIPGLYQTLPASSCAAILELSPSSLSGYYWVRSSTGTTLRAYCDMTRTCGGVTGGWTRVAELNMLDETTQCPYNLTEQVFGNNIRTCIPATSDATCTSVHYNLDKIEYSRVCGRIKGYQFGSPDSFFDVGNNTIVTIESNYVDGVSLTHGMNPRQHIWTLAAGHCASECDFFRPTFVSSNFFCDGLAYPNCIDFCNVVLWDGAQCDAESRWFYRQLPLRKTDTIEMRVCKDERGIGEQTPIEQIEIYVQ